MIRPIMDKQFFLTQPSVEATAADIAIARDLAETLEAHRATCVGMAANMIGERKRIIAVLDEASKVLTMFNPEIISMRGEKVEEEGCLSLPGLWADVKRATDVTLKYIDENGHEQVKRARGLLAKAFQHEVDHLDGKLFIDLVDPTLKPQVKKIIKKLRPKWD